MRADSDVGTSAPSGCNDDRNSVQFERCHPSTCSGKHIMLADMTPSAAKCLSHIDLIVIRASSGPSYDESKNLTRRYCQITLDVSASAANLTAPGSPCV